nr:MAG TPA: hypothetical protein [Caudoviricetes sp.]
MQKLSHFYTKLSHKYLIIKILYKAKVGNNSVILYYFHK